MRLLNRLIQFITVFSTEDTLVMVTADHAHTMSIGGYTSRQSDIAGVVDDHNNAVSDNNIASDGNSFTILSYGNGPGKGRHNIK